LKTHHKRTFISLALAIAGACAFLFNSFYREAQNVAITKLNEQQIIHAQQAARGIEDFFATWTRSLNSLSQMDVVIAGDGSVLKHFYESRQAQIMAITRLNERGVILDNFPDSSTVGTNLSHQKHVGELLRNHQPVISDVFKAVEGFDAVALHVPVFRGAEFKGSIGILINFESLAKRYLDVIKIGETGYAWVVSRDGTILYSPIPGFTGKSVFEVIKESPSLDVMVKDMLQGREGSTEYILDKIGVRNGNATKKYAVYLPVHLGNTFWSISVASAEQEVFAGLTSFRNKLTLVIGVLFIFGMVFSTLGARAWLIVKEEEKRKQTEQEIAQQRNQLAHLSRVSMLGELSGSLAHELNQPLASILSNAQAAQRFLAHPQPDLNELRDILEDIVAEDKRAGEVIRRLRRMLKKGELQRQSLCANELIQDVLKLVRSDLLDKGVIARSELALNLPVLHADRLGLQQVLINLVMNACDSMAEMAREDRQLTICTGLAGNDSVLVSVSDNGLGIAQEKLEQVFEPFYTNKAHGMGLGLSVCRTIITVHGGKLWANNNSGRGATFQFTLPVSEGKAESVSRN
jgi:signal transduction histidine kinase